MKWIEGYLRKSEWWKHDSRDEGKWCWDDEKKRREIGYG